MSNPLFPASVADSALARVRGLSVRYLTCDQPVEALSDASFDMAPGELIGVLGESGSGKSTLALSMMGLLPENAKVGGSIFFQHTRSEHSAAETADLMRLGAAQWRAIRGARISMIFQEPRLALSPVMRIGDQISEVLRAHGCKDTRLRKQEVAAILQRVHLPDTDRVYNAYPHQLSGGELHRVAIAQALVCCPRIVIADEATRSLDTTLQAEILDLLRDVNRDLGTAILFITHNPALLAGFAARVIVMYGGRIVEQGPLPQIFEHPSHPFTQTLLHLARTAVCKNDPPIPFRPYCGRQVSCFEYEH